MKGLVEFINEAISSETDLIAIIKRRMPGLDFSKLTSYTGEDDPLKYDKQKENELLIIRGADEGKYKLVGTSEYYNTLTGKDFDSLSLKEKADFDSKNGDIIILVDDKAVYKIDVKVADNYLGDISLGSLVKFDKGGYYLLLCKKGKYFKLISHKDVVDTLKDGDVKLNEPENDYEGYPVNWNGEKLTSEYFVKGSDLRNL